MQALKGRGKARKARKAKDKYAEQDEEDRALALQLLGSAGEIASDIQYHITVSQSCPAAGPSGLGSASANPCSLFCLSSFHMPMAAMSPSLM